MNRLVYFTQYFLLIVMTFLFSLTLGCSNDNLMVSSKASQSQPPSKTETNTSEQSDIETHSSSDQKPTNSDAKLDEGGVSEPVWVNGRYLTCSIEDDKTDESQYEISCSTSQGASREWLATNDNSGETVAQSSTSTLDFKVLKSVFDNIWVTITLDNDPNISETVRLSDGATKSSESILGFGLVDIQYDSDNSQALIMGTPTFSNIITSPVSITIRLDGLNVIFNNLVSVIVTNNDGSKYWFTTVPYTGAGVQFTTDWRSKNLISVNFQNYSIAPNKPFLVNPPPELDSVSGVYRCDKSLLPVNAAIADTAKAGLCVTLAGKFPVNEGNLEDFGDDFSTTTLNPTANFFAGDMRTDNDPNSARFGKYLLLGRDYLRNCTPPQGVTVCKEVKFYIPFDLLQAWGANAGPNGVGIAFNVTDHRTYTWNPSPIYLTEGLNGWSVAP